jgi:alpha-ketoglutarate-dependent taurine dioxygenase
MWGLFLGHQPIIYAGQRRAILERAHWYPAPGEIHPCAADDLPHVADTLLAGTTKTGVGLCLLDRLLGTPELHRLAEQIGAPQPFADSRLHDHVENGTVLQLRADLESTDDRQWKLLFSDEPVVMHTELAMCAPEIQPRWLLFHCVRPPSHDTGGQTLVVSMLDVFHALDPADRAILETTRLAGAVSPFLRYDDGRPVFVFKDGEDPYRWEHFGSADEAGVTKALAALGTALYQKAAVRGVPWRRGMVALVDNHRVFHARSRTRRRGASPRWLQEIRLGGSTA